MRTSKTIGKIGWAGAKGSTTGPAKDTKNPYKFIPKAKYSKEDIVWGSLRVMVVALGVS